MFRKPGRYRSPKSPQRELSVIDKEDFRKWFRQVWDDIPGTNGHGHPAPFPEELAYRLISMFSFVGDAVLDPFLGSATTTAAAMRAHRSSIGFEVERAYFELAKQRLGQRSITSMEVKLGFVEGQHGRAEKVR
jgi:site-specific DNA-methyltransferase (adenine-specific)